MADPPEHPPAIATSREHRPVLHARRWAGRVPPVTTVAIAVVLLLCPGAVAAARPPRGTPPRWPERTVANLPVSAGLFSPFGLSADGREALGLSTTGEPALDRLTTVSLTTGAEARGSLVFGLGQLLSLGAARVYVEPRTMTVTASGAEAPGSTALGALEARYVRGDGPLLARSRDLPLPFGDTFAPVSASSTTGWVGETGRIAEVDLETGRILRQIALPERDAQYSVSLGGSRLYAMAGATGVHPIEVLALSLPSGRIVGSRALLGVGGYLVAVRSGVWVAYRTGMLGTALLLSYPHLATASPAPPTRRTKVPLPGSAQGMGISLSATGSTAWLVDGSGIACANATTGRVRASTSLGSPYGGFGVIGAAGHELYAMTGDPSTKGNRIVVVRAPAACWHRSKR